MSQEKYSEDYNPNLLSPTMAVVSVDYPILVCYNKALACGLPLHFIDSRFLPDNWGRVPCKTEAVHWYLEHVSINKESRTKDDSEFKKDLETAEHCLKLVTVNDGEQVEGNVTNGGME